MRPALLAVIAQPSKHWREHLSMIAADLKLTDADWQDLTPKYGRPRVEDRTLWALTYLRAAGLIASDGRGKNKPTARGLEFIKRAPNPIKPKDLSEFAEFRKFTEPSTKAHKDEAVVENQKPPLERLADAAEELRGALAAAVLEQLHGVHPSRFEQIIVDLMLRMGYGGAGKDAGEVVGKVGDGGIDGIIRQDLLGLDRVYLQAKRWTGSVGVGEVNSFIGALTTRGASKGVMITTSYYTADAKRIAESASHLKLSLIDGAHLASLMIDLNLGVVKEREFAVCRLDSDYFLE